MVKELFGITMEINLKDYSLMKKHMDTEFIFMAMALSMKGIGQRICKMDMEKKLGLMDLNMRDILKKGKVMEKVLI